MAVALALATAPTVHAAAAKDPLIGATREQVLEKYGEPKNTIVAGNREVLLFERDRVTLRDNVVIQVERLPEPVRHTPAEPAPAPAPAAATSTTSTQSTSTTNAPATTTTTPAPSGAASASTAGTPPASPAPDPDAPLEIKVRSAGAHPVTKVEPEVSTSAPAPAATTAVVPATKPAEKSIAPAPVTPTKAVAPATTPPSPATTTTTTTSTPATETTAQTAPASKAGEATKPAEETPAAAPAEPAKADETATAADDKKEKAKVKKLAHRRLDDGDVADEPVVTTSTYVIGAVIIGAGVAFIIWRMRQRQLELAASAVSRTPFSAPVATSSGGGAVFTADLLGKLEWKRFEELVAAYYSKTGVVAARTKTGPASPVHIKISWKGEPRPFALVQCISHPSGLIDAARLQELVAVLGAEDIRRGYVVTTGKFNVPARDFAEEKHITLLPGDILLEKINALPDMARNELMSEVTTGDYTTPSCPKCEAKMVRNPDDPSQWRCATHTDQVIPAK